MGSVEFLLKDGWKRVEVLRKKGVYAGKADIYIFSPDGIKFRSKKELVNYLASNNLPYKAEDLFTAPDCRSTDNSKIVDDSKPIKVEESPEPPVKTPVKIPVKAPVVVLDRYNHSTNYSTPIGSSFIGMRYLKNLQFSFC